MRHTGRETGRTSSRHPIRLGWLPLLATLLGGCSSIPDPFDLFEQDNLEPPAELTDYQPAIKPSARWSADSGAGSEEQYLKLVPAFYKEQILVADYKGDVRSLSRAGGRTGWSRETEAPISGGPGAGDEIVLVGTRDAEVIALNPDDGEELWRKRLSSEILSVPRAEGSMVVVRTIDGQVFGLDANDGEQVWVYDRTVPVLTLRGNSSPVIEGSNVIVGFANGKLVNLDLYTGEPRWETLVTPPSGRTELERIADIDADPLVADGIIYVCTYQGEVAAIALHNGMVLWRQEISSHAGLTVDWRYLYVTDTNDRVWALDRRNGAALWKQEKLLNRRLTAPAVLDDYVLVGDLEGYVHFLANHDGSQQGRIEVSGAPISAAPQVVEGVAYVFSEDGKVTALTPGSEVYEEEPEEESWEEEEEEEETRYFWESDDEEAVDEEEEYDYEESSDSEEEYDYEESSDSEDEYDYEERSDSEEEYDEEEESDADEESDDSDEERFLPSLKF